jgi:nucleoside-diphosphate-sugar epimerase
MKHVLIIGATGMIGKLVLENCLKREDVAKVTVITRKHFDFFHTKLYPIIHTDFLDFSRIENHLIGHDVCFYCLGVYTGKVPIDEFRTITVAYTEVFAEAFRKNSMFASFCFLSGQGADTKEESKILFAKEKGIAENILLKLNFKSTHIFRPGYIYPVEPRLEPNFVYKLMRILYKPLKFVYPNIGVTSEKLAGTMVEVGMKGEGKIYFENEAIRNYGL